MVRDNEMEGMVRNPRLGEMEPISTKDHLVTVARDRTPHGSANASQFLHEVLTLTPNLVRRYSKRFLI